MKALLLALFFVQTAYALPILNKNAAGIGSHIIIWPDHADANHFYFAPSFISHSGEEAEKAFNYFDYVVGCNRFGRNCKSRGMINAILKAQFLSPALEEAMNQIRKARPQARFAVVPMFNGAVEFNASLAPFIDNHSCHPMTAQASDAIPCSLTLNAKGIRKIKPFLFEGNILPMKFNYEILGVNEIEGSKFVDAKMTLGLSVQLGGDMTRHHPDLL